MMRGNDLPRIWLCCEGRRTDTGCGWPARAGARFAQGPSVSGVGSAMRFELSPTRFGRSRSSATRVGVSLPTRASPT
jgi:hypothetical protein